MSVIFLITKWEKHRVWYMEMASHTLAAFTNTVIIIRNTRLCVWTPQTPPPFEPGVAVSSCFRLACETSLLYAGHLGPHFVLCSRPCFKWPPSQELRQHKSCDEPRGESTCLRWASFRQELSVTDQRHIVNKVSLKRNTLTIKLYIEVWPEVWRNLTL